MTPPARTRVAVIGGGPAGAITGALIAREGVEVVVLERERFPRYHVGESLLPAVHPILAFAGAREKIEAHGFVKKYGGFFRLAPGTPAGHVDFRRNEQWTYSYQVVRSEFDKLLLDHAGDQGAAVFEQTAVQGIDWEGDRPVSLTWSRDDATTGQLSFDHLVDASGTAGLLAQRYLRSRTVEPALANVAIGGYWRGVRTYRDDDGAEHPGAFSMETLADRSGWTWAIPLHDGTTSVGLVLHRDTWRLWKDEPGDVEAVYRRGLEACPDLGVLLTEATRTGELRQWADQSYVSSTFGGPGFRIAGDAAAFIDPLLSSGVHLAMLGGLSAAATVCAVLRGDVDEAEGSDFHDRYVRRAYTRFVVTVAGFYGQIRGTIPEGPESLGVQSFQDAFHRLLPVLTGQADLGDTLDPQVLQQALRHSTDMMLEVLQIPTGNPVGRLMSRTFLEQELAHPSDGVDGRFIRWKRGELGLASARWPRTGSSLRRNQR